MQRLEGLEGRLAQLPTILTNQDRFILGITAISAAHQSEFPDESYPREQFVPGFGKLVTDAMYRIRTLPFAYSGEEQFAFGATALNSMSMILDHEDLDERTKLTYYKETIGLIGGGLGRVMMDTVKSPNRESLSSAQLIGLVHGVDIGSAVQLLYASPTPLKPTEQLHHVEAALVENPEASRRISLAWAGLILKVNRPGESSEGEIDKSIGLTDEGIIAIFDHFRQQSDFDAVTELVSQTSHAVFRPVFIHYQQARDKDMSVVLLQARFLTDARQIGIPQ